MELKTNWTSEDTYNAGDLNRVEAMTAQIADSLAQAGYQATLEPIYAGRDITSFEFASSLNRIERNINAVHDGFVPLPGFEAKVWAAGMPFDYRDANRLERNLQLLYLWGGRTLDAFRYCGTFYCGEGGEIY